MKRIFLIFLLLVNLVLYAQENFSQTNTNSSENKEPAISKAIGAGDLNSLKNLINADNVNNQIAPPIYQMTPLMTAIVKKKPEVLKFLIEERNADIYKSYKGWDTLDWPWEFITIDALDPEAKKIADYLFPKYEFYDSFINKVKNASEYSIEKINWPRENVKIFLVGENHGIEEFPKEIAKIIDRLSITHFATEFLAQSEQSIIDDYQKGTLSQEDFKSKIDRKRVMPAYISAKAKGVNIIGLEKFPELPTSREKSAEIFQTEERNKNWMTAITNILDKDPKAKILIYCGYAHSDYENTKKSISKMLVEKYGEQSVYVAKLDGGSRLNSDGPMVYTTVTYMVDKAGRSGENLIMYSDKKDPHWLKVAFGSDMIIHLKRSSSEFASY